MQSKIRIQFANDLQATYCKSAQPPTLAAVIPALTQQEIDKYAQTQKEQTEKYNERKKRREQKFQKLTKEQINQIVEHLKQDKKFKIMFAHSIIQHTEITQLIRKADNLKIMKSINTQVSEFKSKMTMKVMNIFVTYQNQLYNKLSKLLIAKQVLMLQIFEQRLQQFKQISSQQLLIQQLRNALEIELNENCKKHAKVLSQQFVTMYEGIAQIIAQHAEYSRDNKFEQEFQQSVGKVKEYFITVEQQYIKKLQTDINEHYLNTITVILQTQQKLQLN